MPSGCAFNLCARLNTWRRRSNPNNLRRSLIGSLIRLNTRRSSRGIRRRIFICAPFGGGWIGFFRIGCANGFFVVFI